MKSILIVDDHPLVFGGLKNALAVHRDTELELEHARTAAEAGRRLRKKPVPSLTLLDIHLGDGSGFSLLEELRAEGYEFPFAVLTASRDWNHLGRATQLGALGFLLKDAESEQIIANIGRILEGEPVFPDSAPVNKKTPAELVRAFHTLTDREREVVKFIQAGLLNREVAERLGIGVRTVETHRSNACAKLGVHNAVQLSAVLLQLRPLLESP